MQENNTINTEKIEEATLAPDTEKVPSNIHEALSEQTEYKAPSSASVKSSIWDWKDEEIEGPTINKTTEPLIDPAAPITEKPKGTERVPDHKKKASAETATMMYDQALQLGFNYRVNSKFDEKFTPEEKARVMEEDLADKKLDEIEEADRVLKRKWDRYTRKKENKLDAIPLTERETKTVYDAFYHYFKIKDIELPPEWVLAFALVGTTTDRIIETELD